MSGYIFEKCQGQSKGTTKDLLFSLHLGRTGLQRQNKKTMLRQILIHSSAYFIILYKPLDDRNQTYHHQDPGR